MRTTLDVADGVLFAAKELARCDKKMLGQIACELTQRGLSGAPLVQDTVAPADEIDTRFRALGFRTLPPRGGVVTNEMIDCLREQDDV